MRVKIANIDKFIYEVLKREIEELNKTYYYLTSRWKALVKYGYLDRFDNNILGITFETKNDLSTDIFVERGVASPFKNLHRMEREDRHRELKKHLENDNSFIYGRKTVKKEENPTIDVLSTLISNMVFNDVKKEVIFEVVKASMNMIRGGGENE